VDPVPDPLLFRKSVKFLFAPAVYAHISFVAYTVRISEEYRRKRPWTEMLWQSVWPEGLKKTSVRAGGTSLHELRIGHLANKARGSVRSTQYLAALDACIPRRCSVTRRYGVSLRAALMKALGCMLHDAFLIEEWCLLGCYTVWLL
jgi:hypothetical protein